MTASRLVLVLGGARSGKSAHAEAMVRSEPGPWLYIATAQALDSEMETRIEAHRRQRGEGWRTVEAPFDLPGALRDAPPATPVLVDCLTLWLSSLMLAGHDVATSLVELEAVLGRRVGTTVLVSNEVGLGIVPDSELGRAFRDEAGRANQRLAAMAGRVVFMVAGLPMILKEPS